MDAAAWARFKEEMKERARLSTFEGRVQELEAICSRMPGAWPNRPPSERPPEHSQAWFAEEIMLAIASARSLLQHGDASHAAAEAIQIGLLAANAVELRWPEIEQWRRLVDNESKEHSLVGEVYRRIALAGQIPRLLDSRSYAVDMEIEFKDDAGRPSGQRVSLQLKSGDSHLRPRNDGSRVFDFDESHASYWRKSLFPVFLIIGDSQGRIRWMEIRDYLKAESHDGTTPVKYIVFQGERLDTESILRWRRRLLS